MDIRLIAELVGYLLAGMGWWAFMSQAEGRETWATFGWACVWPLVALAGLGQMVWSAARRNLTNRGV
tara:strand:- start:11131 stop:11331 length:201 start_codon:yes stop_codon:yes gene_type:complete